MTVTDISREPQKPEIIRLAAYCRVSSKSADQLHSFAAQIRYYKDYERKNPQYKLVDVYADEGLSGTDMKKRDEQNRLIRDCKLGKIDRIVTKSVSRFARNTQELLVVLRTLKELGVSIYFEEQGIDSDKMNMEMLVTFPGMAAQQESVNISDHLRRSYQMRMESGEFNCCAPAYGYDLVDGRRAPAKEIHHRHHTLQKEKESWRKATVLCGKQQPTHYQPRGVSSSSTTARIQNYNHKARTQFNFVWYPALPRLREYLPPTTAARNGVLDVQ